MLARIVNVAFTSGPNAAFSWIKNARRMKEDASIAVEKYAIIQREKPVVPKDLSTKIDVRDASSIDFVYTLYIV